MRLWGDIGGRRVSILLVLAAAAWFCVNAVLVVHPAAYSYQCGVPGHLGRCAQFGDRRRWLYPVGAGVMTGLVVALLPWWPRRRLRYERGLAIIVAIGVAALAVHYAMYAGHHIRRVGGE